MFLRPALKRLFFALSLALALALVIVCVPKAEERVAAWWLRSHARQSGLAVKFAAIHAGWWQPLVIENLQLASGGRDRAHLRLFAPRVEIAFSSPHLFSRDNSGHSVRFLRIEHARFSLRGRAEASAGAFDWSAISFLLPDAFHLSLDELLIDQSVTHLIVREIEIAAGKDKRGTISIAAASLLSPWLRQTFTQVNGVTRWEDDHLTLAAMTLRKDFTLDSLTLDLSQVRHQRLGAEFATTLLGGRLRANFATERNAKTRIWEGAASALDLSLNQVAVALGFTEPISGTLNASKFTFRGDPRDVLHATASVWLELTGFSWRQRQANLVMLGASMYDRNVQLQELYLKQSHNQFTLSGETTLGANWLTPDFRGDISAAIDDLGALAELFGSSPGAFSGKLAARGRVHTHQRKIDGDLAVTGDGLSLRGVQVDSLTGRVALDAARLRLEQLELKRATDVLRATGDLDFDRNFKSNFSIIVQCRDLKSYSLDLPLIGQLSGPFFGTLVGEGDQAALDGTLSAATDRLSVLGNLHWSGDLVTIPRLDLWARGAAASLTGEMNFANRRQVRASISCAQELRAELPESNSQCIRGLSVSLGNAGQPFHRIECDGSELLLDGTPRGTLCRRDEPEAEMRINIPSY